MTLSRWLRDYLYVPLGGNRGSRARTLLNLLDRDAARRPVARRGLHLHRVGRDPRRVPRRRARAGPAPRRTEPAVVRWCGVGRCVGAGGGARGVDLSSAATTSAARRPSWATSPSVPGRCPMRGWSRRSAVPRAAGRACTPYTWLARAARWRRRSASAPRRRARRAHGLRDPERVRRHQRLHLLPVLIAASFEARGPLGARPRARGIRDNGGMATAYWERTCRSRRPISSPSPCSSCSKAS